MLKVNNFMSLSKAAVLTDYPIKHLNKFIENKLAFVMLLFSTSIKTCSYPTEWKKAFAIALNKVPILSETRPIAIIFAISPKYLIKY